MQEMIPLFVAVFLAGCASDSGGLTSYKPKSTQEAEIMETLVDLEKLHNSKDLSVCLSCYHENGQYQTADTGTTVYKKDLPEMYDSLWDQGLRVQFDNPNISINGDEAVVKISTEWRSKYSGWYGVTGRTADTVYMIHEGDRWLITKFTAEKIPSPPVLSR